MTEETVLAELVLAGPSDLDHAYLAAIEAARGVGLALVRAAPFATAILGLAESSGELARMRIARRDGERTALEAVLELEGFRPDEPDAREIARHALDELDIEQRGDKTRVRATVHLQGVTQGPAQVDLAAELRRHGATLAGTLLELEDARREVDRARHEIDETNKGVLALYAELDDRAEMLRAASELKSAFISSVSHDFRTPLSAILTLTELLLDESHEPLSEEQRRQVELIQGSGESLLQLVNDLLDLARIESGRIKIRVSRFRAQDLLASLAAVMRATLDESAPKLVVEPADGAPELHTDEDKLSQILRNLVSNALAFTEEGEVRVSTRAEGSQLAIQVADTGIGIPPEQQEKIFEEFVQVDSPLQRRRRGTGLGLPISRKLAEALGGELTLRSTPGEGSVFTLRIPREYTGEELVSVETPPRGPR